MDIQRLQGVASSTSGSVSTIDKTLRAATVADAPVAVSPIAQPVAQTPSSPASPAAIAAELQSYLQTSAHAVETTVQFSIDTKTGLPVITVRNAQSGAIVRQLPVDVAVRLLKNFSMGTGTLLDSQS
jgi:flagellar protein FlaG